jgi:two-component system, NarL family, response regulator
MPVANGVEAITAIRAQSPDACIIMLTIYDTDEHIYKGLRAGAKAYLLKDTPCQELLEVIRTVCCGQRHIPSPIAAKLAARMEQPNLSDREHDVLSLMAQGMSNRDIAASLHISEGTVKFHLIIYWTNWASTIVSKPSSSASSAVWLAWNDRDLPNEQNSNSRYVARV